MTGVEELSRLMGELEEQLVVCMRCGMCQAVCPIYNETGRESDVARGKLALLDGLLHKMLENPEAVLERLNRCLLCGSCAASCPSGVSAMEIFLKARAILVGYMGLSPAKRLILRGMLKRPGLFDKMAEWGVKFQSIFSRPANEILGTSCARIASPLIGDRHFVAPARTPFHQTLRELDTAAGRSGLRVAFFPGCLLDKIYPRVARAAVDVLQHHGVGIFMPPGQGCCGIPALSSGDLESFRSLVRHNLELFKKGRFDHLVTACATCTATIHEVWPVMTKSMEADTARAVAALAGKTLDINAFLVSKLGVKAAAPEKDATPVTYHDPCHLKKSLGVSAEPRAVLQANARYRLVEMPEADRCCGMGGSFNLQYYEISSRIGERKRENIRSTGATVVATGCPACMMQISDALSKAGERIAVKHPVEIYAEGMALR